LPIFHLPFPEYNSFSRLFLTYNLDQFLGGRSLAQQNEQAFKDVIKILREHFTEEELKEILPL